MSNKEIVVEFMEWAWDLGFSVEVGDHIFYDPHSGHIDDNKMLRLRLSHTRDVKRSGEQIFSSWQDLARCLRDGYIDKLCREVMVPSFSEYVEGDK